MAINRENINFYKKNGYYRYPLTMQLEITRACPFNCPQCYKVELEEKHMMFGMISQYVTMGIKNGVKVFVLNGGEPLLHPQIEEIIDLFQEHPEVHVNCFSSGYGLNDKIIRSIKEVPNFHFYISLNGSTKEINNLSRQGFDISMNAVKELEREKCTFGINWVARKDNIDDFSNMISLCRKYHVSNLSVTSNKLAQVKTKLISELDYASLEKLANIIINNNDITITTEACFPQLTKMLRKLTDSDGCAAGIYNVNISLEGYYLPCTHLYYPEKWNSIEEYWHNSQILKELRENAKCRNCSANCRFCKAMSVEGYKMFHKGIENCMGVKQDER